MNFVHETGQCINDTGCCKIVRIVADSQLLLFIHGNICYLFFSVLLRKTSLNYFTNLTSIIFCGTLQDRGQIKRRIDINISGYTCLLIQGDSCIFYNYCRKALTTQYTAKGVCRNDINVVLDNHCKDREERYELLR